jgi:hypothetical protein
MPLLIFVMFLKVIHEASRVFRKKKRGAKPEPLCVGCLHAHVQYAADAKRAISCAFAGALRPMKLDVLYCTDYETRNAPVRTRAVGFAREIVPAE